MKSIEDLTKELNDISRESFKKAQELSEVLKKYNDIDIEVENVDELTEEEQNNIKGFLASIDARRQAVLRRLLVEWGGLLFM